MSATEGKAARNQQTRSSLGGRLPLLARGVALLVLMVYVTGLSVNAWLESRIGLQGENSMEDLVLFVGFGMFAAVGALLVAKRPENRVGWVMGAAALIMGVFPAGESYAAYVMTTRGRPDALAVLGAWANGWYWLVLLALVFIYLPLLFPDGRLLSRRWLPVAVLPAIGIVGIMVLGSLAETFKGQTLDYRIENPIGVEGLANIEELPAFVVLTGIYAIGAVGALASLAVRFRRSRGTERQQLKWFLFAAAPILTIPMENYLPEFVESFMLAWVVLGFPAAIGIAVLRYRLYDIDLVINRTLVYAALTASLAAVYLGSVVGLQRLLTPLTGEGNQLAVVASTLLIAALFGPLRRRVQGFIDRRFYRRKYDAQKTLESFSAKLRGASDLEGLNEELLVVVRETVQPEHASLWLRKFSREARP
ncbi:MAG: hypothetical protein M3N33_09385 [Actinomycetota bacterium]|nr:hypothetical protein [Actinomycetota bacterium]